MKQVFKYPLLIFTCFILLLGCKTPKEKELINLSKEDELNVPQIEEPPQIENTVPQGTRSGFYENKEDWLVRNINGLSRKANFPEDKYANSYLWDDLGFRCYIDHSPDLEVIMDLQNYIEQISICTGESYSATITNISFLEHLPQLKRLSIQNGKEIETFEPLKYLVSLEELYIEDGYKGTFDCSILNNLKNLKSLTLLVDNLSNRETIFNLPNLDKIWLCDYAKNSGLAFNHEPGKYNILQYRANIRTEPSRNSDVLALLHLHDEVEILENSGIAEKINDVWGFWYKIKHGDIVGYTFGGNFANRTFITDMDKNGIKDYFYYRYSSSGGWGKVNTTIFYPKTDLIIYINNQRIDTSIFSESEWFNYVIFEEEDDHVLMGLSEEGRHGYQFMQIYKVTSDGKIEHLADWDERDYW
jgi:hypothetical protein